MTELDIFKIATTEELGGVDDLMLNFKIKSDIIINKQQEREEQKTLRDIISFFNIIFCSHPLLSDDPLI